MKLDIFSDDSTMDVETIIANAITKSILENINIISKIKDIFDKLDTKKLIDEKKLSSFLIEAIKETIEKLFDDGEFDDVLLKLVKKQLSDVLENISFKIDK